MTTTAPRSSRRPTITPLHASLLALLRTSNPQPALRGRADDFELAKRETKARFILLSDDQTLALAEILASTETRPLSQDAAFDLLFRAAAPEALLAAAKSERFEDFPTAWTAAQVALSTLIHRWDPSKGLRFLAYVRAVLPAEMERERKASQLIDNADWAGKSVTACIGLILEGLYNRPWTTRYVDCQGDVQSLGQRRLTLIFPEFTAVTRDRAGRIVSTEPEMTSRVVEERYTVKGEARTKLKELKTPVANPMLAWFQPKTNTVKAFAKRTRNWPRKQQRSKTGYKLSDLSAASHEFTATVLGQKFTALWKQRLVFRKPFRPMRRDDVSPRMIREAMRRHRKANDLAFDTNAWTIARIADIMSQLVTVTSYDEVIEDGDGDTTRKSDLIAAQPHEGDEYEAACERIIQHALGLHLHPRTPVAALLRQDLPDGLVKDIALATKGQARVTIGQIDREFQPEFNDDQLEDAKRITERLQTSGLWEIAMTIPTHKFLAAYHAGRPGFCTLCSRYGIRVKHGLQIMQAIDAALR